MRKFMFLISIFFAVSSFITLGTAHADWAYRFVVNDGKSYIVSDTQVESAQIGAKIGKVTSYSDEEGTYSGNFSNIYPKGTEYYAIKDISINEAIAIKQDDGSFIKAAYGSEYEGKAINLKSVLFYIGGLFLLIIAFLFVKNNWRQSDNDFTK
ncbi:hypothetical protein AB4Z17_08865 [Paenibacillus sp. TAF43_2]|uniref:hypothetical protein n=1 Tax=Paenibacillus sp. TAF43_2 TaxID=3233069 RepID=UPI003F9D381D